MDDVSVYSWGSFVVGELWAWCRWVEADRSKASLKLQCQSVPAGHSVQLKETCENMQIVLEKLKYNKHKWIVCGKKTDCDKTESDWILLLEILFCDAKYFQPFMENI